MSIARSEEDASHSDQEIVGEEVEVVDAGKDGYESHLPKLRSSYDWANITYRHLQLMARRHGIPCNLKKEMLKTILQAKMKGYQEDVNYLLNQVRETRIKRKRLREEQANELCKTFKPTIPQSLSLHIRKKDKTYQIVEDIVRRMVRETTARNVTICQTQTQAQYRTFMDPRRSVRYPSLKSGRTFVPLCHTHNGQYNYSGYQTDLSNPFWHQPSGERTFVPLYNNDTLMQPNCNSIPSTLVSGYSNNNMLPYTPVPVPYTNQPQERLPSFNNIRRNEAACDNTSNHLDEIIDNKPAQLDSTSVSAEHNQTMPMSSHVEPQTKLDYSFKDSSGLDFLANTAMTMSQQDLESQQKNSSSNRLNGSFSDFKSENNYCNQKSELIMGHSGKTKTTTKEIPTWNNFLEQMIWNSTSNNMSGVSCKYGCHTPFSNKTVQQEHETHCVLQPFECPFPECSWFNQLRSLDTHIYIAHNEVVLNAESTFTVSFGSELYNSSFGAGPSNTGPKRLCFLQLVKDRLFVISVLGNFQSMQVYVYIQYLNDNHHWFSTAALEVTHPDGMLHQWIGRVQPLSFTPTKLIARQACLIFNITVDQLAAAPFCLHTMVRTHELG
ncbi:uncharacterized protein LOC124353154 isoform X1 [Homalodisca vitripennis]|uniref:uncharacterized protein LOC124353154 isoform X1 n=1 Tax=Homalodisca vitripennis TaxID=197043 RepID=UPI001EECEDED|nr:uncharacterized protein LOC124353154 isoform X1 [Homalodisca vitripennis]